VAVQRLHGAVLAVDLMGGRQQLARRLLAQDVAVAGGVGEQEEWGSTAPPWNCWTFSGPR
jgi:hypothetical protein